MRLLSVLTLAACATGAAAEGPDEAGETGGDEDTGGTTAENLDTGLALVYFEGEAAFADGAWTGTETWHATDRDGAVDRCVATYAVAGTATASPLCATCTFGYDVAVTGGDAVGEACAALGLGPDRFDGARWIYAFAPEYTDAVAYDEVLLRGEETDGAFAYTVVAIAETSGAVAIAYEGLATDTRTYPLP